MVRLRVRQAGACTAAKAEHEGLLYMPRLPRFGEAVTFDVEAVFAEEFAKAASEQVNKSGFATDTWFFTGRKSVGADLQWWDENGPAMCQAFIDWYQARDDIKVWTTPDGRPAIELELEVMFGKVPVRMFIDQVLQAGTALIVVDDKTAARKPDSLRQLATYASGIELAYGVRPRYGAYFMARKAAATEGGGSAYHIDVSPLDGYQHSIEYLTGQFETFDRAVGSGLFLANPGQQCGRCGVAYKCSEYTGRKEEK